MVDWWAVFKFNSASFPGCAATAQRVCAFGGSVQHYHAFSQQYVVASSESKQFNQGTNCLGDTTDDPVGASFDEVYNGTFYYVIWNDQFYTHPPIQGCGNSCSAPWGHPTLSESAQEILMSHHGDPCIKTYLFACTHNAGRSQMAAAFFNLYADPTGCRALDNIVFLVTAGFRDKAYRLLPFFYEIYHETSPFRNRCAQGPDIATPAKISARGYFSSVYAASRVCEPDFAKINSAI